MSTRCNIILICDEKRELYYHHWDGYPSGVGADLLERMDVGARGISFFDKEKQSKIYKKFKELLEAEGHYEPTDNVSGDIEYLYYVTLKDNKCTISYSAVHFWDASEEDIKEYLQSDYGDFTLILTVQETRTDTCLREEKQ